VRLAPRLIQTQSFDNEWILQVFEDHPSFFTKRMFGGLAVYLFGRQMMLLVPHTNVCTVWGSGRSAIQ